MIAVVRSFLMIAALALAAPAVAQRPALQVSDAWVQAPPTAAAAAAGYLRLRNRGDTADRLLAVSTERAGRTELHTIVMDGDVARMRPLRYGVALPAGADVRFAPTGIHIMFSSVSPPFQAGETVRLRLTFQHAGVIETTARVRAR